MSIGLIWEVDLQVILTGPGQEAAEPSWRAGEPLSDKAPVVLIVWEGNGDGLDECIAAEVEPGMVSGDRQLGRWFRWRDTDSNLVNLERLVRMFDRTGPMVTVR